MDRKKWNKVYNRLPKAEKRMPVVVIDGKPCSWNVVNTEVKCKTEMSERMLEQLTVYENALERMNETKVKCPHCGNQLVKLKGKHKMAVQIKEKE